MVIHLINYLKSILILERYLSKSKCGITIMQGCVVIVRRKQSNPLHDCDSRVVNHLINIYTTDFIK